MNVKTLCLGTLCLKEGTGYEIKKLFESAFSHFHSASYGSIYPALKQLLEEEYVTCRVEPGARHPERRLYSVTPAGREAFNRALSLTPPAEQVRSEFLVLMFFSHLLTTRRLEEILKEMESQYEQELHYLESLTCCPDHTTGIRFTIDYGITTIGAALDFIRERRGEILTHHRNQHSNSGGGSHA